MTTSLLEKFARLVNQDPLFRPRRIVTRSGVRVRGIFPSVRFNRTLHWESALERDLVHRLESSWLLADACTQPTTVSVPSADGTRFQLHTRCAGFDQARPALLPRVQAVLQTVRPVSFSEAEGHRHPSSIAGDRLFGDYRGRAGSRGLTIQHQTPGPRAQRSRKARGNPPTRIRAFLTAYDHIRAAGRPSRTSQSQFCLGSRCLVFRCASADMRLNAAVQLTRGEI